MQAKSIMLGIIILLILSLIGEHIYYESQFSPSDRYYEFAFKLGVVRGLDTTDNNRCINCNTYGNVADFAWNEYINE